MSRDGLFPELATWDPAPLRRSLRQCGFHRTALEALGMPDRWLRSDIARAALLGHVPPGSPIDSLMRLFTLGDPLEGSLALPALGDAFHGLLDLGFLEASGGTVRSRYQICPIDDGWIACDFRARQKLSDVDCVMGVGPSSVLLASLTPPLAQGRALELASGIGWLASHLARTGMTVVATDLNQRALDLGRFNARLAGDAGIDFRHGDGFSSVAGERFDRIVANPPYVQSPGGSMLYKEAQPGDPVLKRLLRALPDHLNPGGIGVVLINWSHASDEDWEDAPLSWVPTIGTRRWLFQSDCLPPADYAWKWISGDPRFSDEQAGVAEMERWLAHYRKTGVERISGGFIIIQKCDPGGEWTRVESRSIENIDPAGGAEVLRVLNNETWLATAPPLLETRFKVAEGVQSEVRMSLGAGDWERQTIRLTSPARLSYDGQIDENILRLLSIVRQGKTPAALVEEIRSRPEFASIPDLPERIFELVRELVSQGMLVPA